jgi:hypothetical protein
MDEVLSHALIVGEGECLFKKADLPYEVMAKDIEKQDHCSLM